MPVSVSVALCTHNGVRYLEDQLRSILGQSRPIDQLVVADDASTDGTVALVRDLVRNTAGIDVVILPSTTRVGVTANFERAIARCDRDIIVLSDQDDTWRPDRVALAVAAFEDDPGLQLVHGDAAIVDETGRESGMSLFESLRIGDREIGEVDAGRAFSVLLRRNLVTGAATAFRASLRDAAVPFPASWLHDEWLAIIAAATGRVRTVRDVLIDYRQHGDNVVGVVRPTLRYRLGRMLGARAGRYEILAERATRLVDRLESLDVAERDLERARWKAKFEEARAGYPRARPARLPRIVWELLRGSYRELSSQRSLDALRDLLQPA